MKKYDLIVIGAGVAGMVAGIYAKRAGKSVLVLEGKVHGGQIIQTIKVGNWPGELVISGMDLSEKIYYQADKLGVEFCYEEVVSLKKTEEVISVDEVEKPIWMVETDDDNYTSSAIIIAVGTKDRELGLPREEELVGKGVSYCATCDGAFYKGRDVIVVGGGNTALYDALYLADIAKKVYLVHRRDEFRGDAMLVERLKEKGNVEFMLKHHLVELKGKEKVDGVVIEDSVGERKDLKVDGVFVAIGRVPSTDIFKEIVALDEVGYVIAGEDCKTSAPGVFVAGDCRTKQIRQLVTAAADGAVAGMAACRYLD